METDFLGVPDVDSLLFSLLTLAAFCTAFLGTVTGAAGGLLMMVILASIFPPAASIPIHTVVQMGGNVSRVLIMWRQVMRGIVPAFLIGAIIGATLGGQIFVTLPTAMLQGFLGAFVIVITWLPSFAQVGGRRGRFALVGLVATFLGIFVSATGTLIAPFVAADAPDRRNYVATFAAMMVIIHSSKLVAFGFLGVVLAPYLPLMFAMVAAASLANLIGSRLLHRMVEGHFRLIFKVVVTLLALRLVWLAANEAGLI